MALMLFNSGSFSLLILRFLSLLTHAPQLFTQFSRCGFPKRFCAFLILFFLHLLWLSLFVSLRLSVACSWILWFECASGRIHLYLFVWGADKRAVHCLDCPENVVVGWGEGTLKGLCHISGSDWELVSPPSR